MSLLYSKLRLQIPQVAEGKNATITSPRGVNRTVPMTYPLTDVFVAGMDKYTVQAGTGSESFSVGNGKLKKIVTEDVSALTVATMPTKTTYLVGGNLNLAGVVIDATISKGDNTSDTIDVTSQCTFSPPDGTQLNTTGNQTVNVLYRDVSTSFDVVVSLRSLLKKLPVNFRSGQALIYNGEIHFLGGYSTQLAHYKWDRTNWVSVSTLPYNFAYGGAVVYNNEIHILGSIYSSNYRKHYKWDGSSWSSVSTLPVDFTSGCAVVYNNQIHLLGTGSGSTPNGHYYWDGTSWQNGTTLPYGFINGSAVVFNNQIHILGSYQNYRKHYKWNGSSWSSVSTLPFDLESGSAVVFNGDIHILNTTSHYKWNGSTWSSVSTLPYNFNAGSGVVWNSGGNDEIVILGTATSSYEKYDAQWDGSTWTVGSD